MNIMTSIRAESNEVMIIYTDFVDDQCKEWNRYGS